MRRLFFLGPKGTYSEQAALKVKELIPDCDLNEVPTIINIVDMVDKDIDCIGVLPIENSIEGIVRPSVDNIYISSVQIHAQIDIKIRHCIISKNNKKEKVKHIISHPQALAQCQKYILKNFSRDIDLIEAKSTASAGCSLIDYDESYAAIVSENMAQKMQLNILDKNIGDNKENKTRFVLISRDNLDKEYNFGKKTRTSFVFNTKNEPGALLKILNIINEHNLNLIYLESRPSKEVFGEYNFFADVDRGIDEIIQVLDKIKAQCNYYKLLGSYAQV